MRKDKQLKPKVKKDTAMRGLKEENKLIRELMDHIPDVIYFKDASGRLILVNQAHAKGLGLSPKEVIGKTDADIFGARRAAAMDKDDRYVMSSGKPIIDKIERSTRADGVDNYVSTTKIPRFDLNGRVIGIIGITRDITQRMQLVSLRQESDRLKKKIEALREMDRLKSEFISVASHELRTPLAIIKEAIGIILDGIKGPVNHDQRELLFKSENNVARLSKIIEELLDMSRIERGKFKLRYSLINLSDLIRDSADFYLKLAKEKGLDLVYKLPKEEINIFVDPGRLTQIISNLIDNAIKFTERGGKIEIEVRVFEEKIRVGVFDSGIGIAKRDLDKIFQKFIQVSRPKSEAKNKGIGLGLAIVKELVVKHDGEIWVESQPGLGSKFYFTLPRFYTLRAVSNDLKEKINELLERNLSLYLIDILILNYKEFKKTIAPRNKGFLLSLENIIRGILDDFIKQNKHTEKAYLSDFERGETSILLPGVKEAQVVKLCAVIKDRVREYFSKKRIENTFINIGIMHLAYNDNRLKFRARPLKIEIKKILIGINKRRFRRAAFHDKIEQYSGQNLIGIAEGIDISVGGISFFSTKRLETDSHLVLKLTLSNKHHLSLKGRVAWISEIDEGARGEPKKFKIGFEFSGLTLLQKKSILRFVRSETK